MSSKWISIQNILASEEEKDKKKTEPQKIEVDDHYRSQADLDQVDQDQDQPFTQSPKDSVLKRPSLGDVVSKRPSTIKTQSLEDQVSKKPSLLETKSPEDLVKGYLLPNWILDELMPTLQIVEQIVLHRVIRLSLGFNRQLTDSVSLGKLSEKCNITPTPLKKAIKSLETRGIIKIHSDLSHSCKGGNKYELLLTNLVSKRPSLQKTQSPKDYITDHDDHDLNNTNHHQGVMTIYQNLTSNIWSKSDEASYQKIKHLSIQEISQLIKSTLEKAHQKPASLAYFVKAYLNPTTINPTQRNANKQKLAIIVKTLQELNVGRSYKIADLLEDTKRSCIRDGVLFDNDLFNELLEKNQS